MCSYRLSVAVLPRIGLFFVHITKGADLIVVPQLLISWIMQLFKSHTCSNNAHLESWQRIHLRFSLVFSPVEGYSMIQR